MNWIVLRLTKNPASTPINGWPRVLRPDLVSPTKTNNTKLDQGMKSAAGATWVSGRTSSAPEGGITPDDHRLSPQATIRTLAADEPREKDTGNRYGFHKVVRGAFLLAPNRILTASFALSQFFFWNWGAFFLEVTDAVPELWTPKIL
jgi:hypothetical protein